MDGFRRMVVFFDLAVRVAGHRFHVHARHLLDRLGFAAQGDLPVLLRLDDRPVRHASRQYQRQVTRTRRDHRADRLGGRRHVQQRLEAVTLPRPTFLDQA